MDETGMKLLISGKEKAFKKCYYKIMKVLIHKITLDSQVRLNVEMFGIISAYLKLSYSLLSYVIINLKRRLVSGRLKFE